MIFEELSLMHQFKHLQSFFFPFPSTKIANEKEKFL